MLCMLLISWMDSIHQYWGQSVLRCHQAAVRTASVLPRLTPPPYLPSPAVARPPRPPSFPPSTRSPSRPLTILHPLQVRAAYTAKKEEQEQLQRSVDALRGMEHWREDQLNHYRLRRWAEVEELEALLAKEEQMAREIPVQLERERRALEEAERLHSVLEQTATDQVGTFLVSPSVAGSCVSG